MPPTPVKFVSAFSNDSPGLNRGGLIKFKKGGKLGVGVFGEVVELGSEYVMKVMKRRAGAKVEVACNNEVLKRLAKVSGLRQKHTLLLDTKTANGIAGKQGNIVNIKCKGRSVASFIYTKQKAPGLFAKTTIAVLAILIALHGAKKPIFHADIKPPNLMLCDGVVKVIDFGACAYADTKLDVSTLCFVKHGYGCGTLNEQQRVDISVPVLGWW